MLPGFRTWIEEKDISEKEELEAEVAKEIERDFKKATRCTVERDHGFIKIEAPGLLVPDVKWTISFWSNAQINGEDSEFDLNLSCSWKISKTDMGYDSPDSEHVDLNPNDAVEWFYDQIEVFAELFDHPLIPAKNINFSLREEEVNALAHAIVEENAKSKGLIQIIKNIPSKNLEQIFNLIQRNPVIPDKKIVINRMQLMRSSDDHEATDLPED